MLQPYLSTIELFLCCVDRAKTHGNVDSISCSTCASCSEKAEPYNDASTRARLIAFLWVPSKSVINATSDFQTRIEPQPDTENIPCICAFRGSLLLSFVSRLHQCLFIPIPWILQRNLLSNRLRQASACRSRNCNDERLFFKTLAIRILRDSKRNCCVKSYPRNIHFARFGSYFSASMRQRRVQSIAPLIGFKVPSIETEMRNKSRLEGVLGVTISSKIVTVTTAATKTVDSDGDGDDDGDGDSDDDENIATPKSELKRPCDLRGIWTLRAACAREQLPLPAKCFSRRFDASFR